VNRRYCERSPRRLRLRLKHQKALKNSRSDAGKYTKLPEKCGASLIIETDSVGTKIEAARRLADYRVVINTVRRSIPAPDVTRSPRGAVRPSSPFLNFAYSQQSSPAHVPNNRAESVIAFINERPCCRCPPSRFFGPEPRPAWIFLVDIIRAAQ